MILYCILLYALLTLTYCILSRPVETSSFLTPLLYPSLTSPLSCCILCILSSVHLMYLIIFECILLGLSPIVSHSFLLYPGLSDRRKMTQVTFDLIYVVFSANDEKFQKTNSFDRDNRKTPAGAEDSGKAAKTTPA